MDFQARWSKTLQNASFHPTLKQNTQKPSPLVDLEVTTDALGFAVTDEFRSIINSMVNHEAELSQHAVQLEGHATLAARILQACNNEKQIAFGVYIKVQQQLRVCIALRSALC